MAVGRYVAYEIAVDPKMLGILDEDDGVIDEDKGDVARVTPCCCHV